MKSNSLFIITIGLILLTSSVSAQWSIGVSGGCAYNHYDYDPQYMLGLDFKAHHGFVADLPIHYQFNDWFSLSSGLSFQEKGYRMTGECMNAYNELIRFYRVVCRDDYYLTLPLSAKFTMPFGQTKLKAFFDVGGYAAYWIHSNFSIVETYSLTNHFCYVKNYPKEFRDDVDRRIELGLVGGLGVEYLARPRLTIFCTARCYLALAPQQKEYQIMHFPSRNTTITGQFGIMYNFKQEKQ